MLHQINLKGRLDNRYIGCRRSLGTLLDIKGDLVAFIKGFKASGIDRGMMNEYIRSIFLLDKTKTFLIVKPFYSSISHDTILLSLIFQHCLQDATIW